MDSKWLCSFWMFCLALTWMTACAQDGFNSSPKGKSSLSYYLIITRTLI